MTSNSQPSVQRSFEENKVVRKVAPPSTCLILIPASELTSTDEAIVTRLSNRIWDAGFKLLRATSPADAEALFREYGHDLAAIFIVARRSCYRTWALVGIAQMQKIAQFVVARFRLEEGASILHDASRLVELPAERPGIDPALDRELNAFFQALPPAPGLSAPRQAIQMFPATRPLTAASPEVNIRCSSHEVCTLSEISFADQRGISLRDLGFRLNRSGIVHTMSLSINSLRRKGLIQFNPPENQVAHAGYVERTLSITAFGQHYLTECDVVK
jgi:hypothetical protein